MKDIIEGSRTKNTSRNIIWGVLNRLLAVILPFCIRTIIIHFLGLQYVGLGNLFSSILQVLSLAELGFGSALIFCMYKPMAERDITKVGEYLNYYKKCYRIIGLIVLALGLAIMPFLKSLISGDYPQDINIYLLYIVYLANSVASYFLFAYWDSILIASQRGDIKSKITSTILILQNVIQIVVLICFKNYYVYSLFIPLSTIATNLTTVLIAKRVFPAISCSGNLTIDERRQIRSKVSGLIFQKIGGVVLTSVDSIVISSFLGLTTLAIYNNYYYIISSLFSFIAVLQIALIPTVGNSVQCESKDKNYTDFKLFHFIYIWILIFCCSCLLCLYQPFITIWVGPEATLSFSMVILLVLYFYSFKMGDISYIYKEAIGIWREGRFVPLIAAIINLITNIVLVYYIGLPGIVISTLISIIFVYFPFGAYPLFSVYFQDTKKFSKYIIKQIIYILIAVIIVSVCYWICSLLPLTGVVQLLANLFVCFIVSNLLMFILFFWTDEFRSLRSFVMNKFLKIIRKG